MPAAPRPLRQADFRKVRAVFTDVDGTLTTAGRVRASTVRMLERLADAGIPIVLVTGRPSGYGEAWLRTLPVDGVIAENGGLWFARAADGTVRKTFARPAAVRAADRRRLARAVTAALRQVRGARLSSDSVFREVDLAIDYNEEVRLGSGAADRLEAWLRARGVQAVRSSVHVNCWIGPFDKATAVRGYLQEVWGVALARSDARFVYAGDSLNDAPLFAAFALSVGVANVRAVLGRIDAPPRFITRAAEGAGFEELARAVLRQRGAR